MRYSEEIAERSKGKPDCKICGGEGSRMFEGTRIFCEGCHTEAEITALWQMIDSYVTKHVEGRR